MKAEYIEVLETCASESLNGTATFPEILEKLSAIGVERYHADYCRQEITYYLPDSDSHVVSIDHEKHQIGKDFDATAVQNAVRQSQRNEHSYKDFVKKTMAAGCVGYFVQLTGRQVIYFGRNGDSHVERFP